MVVLYQTVTVLINVNDRKRLRMSMLMSIENKSYYYEVHRGVAESRYYIGKN